jgi:phosphoribosyl-ATP pyrophosphohydrolase/phosphoribosyl-AMP cyclohydrolase
MSSNDLSFLSRLEQIIDARIAAGDTESYTARLAAAGPKRVAQKVGEEAVELALAAVAGDREEQIEETADLLYHLAVLLNLSDIRLADVVETLARRHSD